MTTWPKITIRTIAVGNVTMGALGLFLQLESAVRFSQRHQFIGTRPGETYVYSTLACIAFAFALLALVSGFFLWRTSRTTLRLCNLLFGSELVYWSRAPCWTSCWRRPRANGLIILRRALLQSAGSATWGSPLRSFLFIPFGLWCF